MGIVERKEKDISNPSPIKVTLSQQFVDYLKDPKSYDSQVVPFMDSYKDDAEDTRSAEYQFSLAKNIADQYYESIYALCERIITKVPSVPKGYNLSSLQDILVELVGNFQEFYQISEQGEQGSFNIQASKELIISQLVIKGDPAVASIRKNLKALIHLIYQAYKEVSELYRNVDSKLNDKGTKTLRWELSMFSGNLYSTYKNLVLNFYNNHDLWIKDSNLSQGLM